MAQVLGSCRYSLVRSQLRRERTPRAPAPKPESTISQRGHWQPHVVKGHRVNSVVDFEYLPSARKTGCHAGQIQARSALSGGRAGKFLRRR